MSATAEQRAKVVSAVADALEPFDRVSEATPDNIKRARMSVYHALYKLACEGVIPYEITLDVEIVVSDPLEGMGFAARLSKPMQAWLGVVPQVLDTMDALLAGQHPKSNPQ